MTLGKPAEGRAREAEGAGGGAVALPARRQVKHRLERLTRHEKVSPARNSQKQTKAAAPQA
eukprot:11029156-Alexandrium_andersonii.AAC.1